ncbi:hypothetical protein E0H51_19225 [Rhizobium leguminosarum bv. viciae]|nr:hypothetical protein [Rhizobium leguminosarum bv. viciae]TBY74982.1 hypothetical protein E0H51_19225 [Rhizobium leguminosarum bv. viciae]TBZ10154.1 hypothetical protein E0H33_25115 [Rhizobium leguminosarum bv. viciae]TCA04013.1 hypothetical protein E0H57_17050 [Rhizobium leguminosarum bv. viciae]
MRKVAVVCFALSLLMRWGRGLSLNRVGTYTFGAVQRHRPEKPRGHARRKRRAKACRAKVCNGFALTTCVKTKF